MSATTQPTWNLDTLYSGGAASPELHQAFDTIEHELQVLESNPAADADIRLFLNRLQHIGTLLTDADHTLYALRAQDPQDAEVNRLSGRVAPCQARLASLHIRLVQALGQMPAAAWDALLSDPAIQPIAYLLKERRNRVQEKMSPAEEQLATALSADGLHAWGNLRHRQVGRMRFHVEVDGKTEAFGMGQVFGALSHPNRATRQSALDAIDREFGQQAELFAQSLNALSGFKLTLYKQRGWDSALHEPLGQNQLSEQTLNAMHGVLERNAPALARFFHRKAERMGLQKLSYFDITAPFASVNAQVSFEDAAALIVEQFGTFSADMAALASRAFSEGWIDAADRPGKGGGGVCIPFHQKKQSRIWMSFRGRMLDTLILAHELGHAYHNSVIHDLPELARNYPMSVAETASVFCEVIVMDALIRSAKTDEERLNLLAEKMQRVLPFQLLGVYSGFLFEKSFYEERKNGIVSPERLNALVIDAQKRAYANSLDRYHPHLWAMQPHLYATQVPFYNFPYTFGYLFSMGLYAKALAEGPAFADKYRSLLRDTGRMSVEELAARDLDADLTQPEFWQNGLNLLLRDLDEFLRLTE